MSLTSQLQSTREALDPLGFQCERKPFVLYLRQRIAEWKRGGARFCVLLVRIEQEGGSDESQSRQADDALLRLTARVLHTTIREMDLIGRYEHDCFSVLLPCTTIREGMLVAQRVRQNINLSVPPFDRSPLRFSLHVGVAEVTQDDETGDLLQRAETSLAGNGG